MSICCCWLDVLFRPRSSVCATRISLGLMINAVMLLASSRRLIFGGPVIALGLTGKNNNKFNSPFHLGHQAIANYGPTHTSVRKLTGKFLHCQVRANETYSEAKCHFSTRNGMFRNHHL